jgi:hypothetical protein
VTIRDSTQKVLATLQSLKSNIIDPIVIESIVALWVIVLSKEIMGWNKVELDGYAL